MTRVSPTGETGSERLCYAISRIRCQEESFRPSASTPVVRAVLAAKHVPLVTSDEIDALRPHAGLDARLVVTEVDWSPGWPRMTYAVESFMDAA